MPNYFAYSMLLLWPVLAPILFAKMAPPRGLTCALLGGLFFLPEKTVIQFSGVPDLDKTTAAIISVFIMDIFIYRNKFIFLPKQKIEKLFILFTIIFPIITVYTNRDGFLIGSTFVRGLNFSDVTNMCFTALLIVYSWRLGVQRLNSEERICDCLSVFTIIMAFYGLLIFLELWIAPVLHSQIYGFFPHEFYQHIRGNGYRPLVFMEHTLVISKYCAMALISILVLAPSRDIFSKYQIFLILYFILIMVLSKSLSALVLGFTAAVPLFFARSGRAVLIITILSAVILVYPILRSPGIFPSNEIINVIENFNEERARSLAFRFNQEENSLLRAEQRFLFGWGGVGRDKVRNPYSGENISTLDGGWIITVGQHGYLGFLIRYGLYLYPLVLLWKRQKIIRQKRIFIVFGLATILLIPAINSIPNHGIRPFDLILSGALTGLIRRVTQEKSLKKLDAGDKRIIL